MPVKDKSVYPPDWKAISLRIRERAGNKCEICGVENHSIIMRSTVDAERYLVLRDDVYCTPNGSPVRLSELPSEYDDAKDIRIVLTVAHMNHDTSDNSDGNLKALCQLHHLRHDAKHHAQNASHTRREKKRVKVAATGQLELL